MIVIPALTLNGGRCTPITSGTSGREPACPEDPLSVARDWVQLGFNRLHIADLDTGPTNNDNVDVIRNVLREITAHIQVEGSLCDEDRIETVLDDGATLAVLGERAVSDEAWLEEMTLRYPHRLIVTVEGHDGRLILGSSTANGTQGVIDFVRDHHHLPLAGLMVNDLTTVIGKGSSARETRLSLMEDIVEMSPWQVLASGIFSDGDDLLELRRRGVGGVILNAMPSTGPLSAHRLIEGFGG